MPTLVVSFLPPLVQCALAGSSAVLTLAASPAEPLHAYDVVGSPVPTLATTFWPPEGQLVPSGSAFTERLAAPLGTPLHTQEVVEPPPSLAVTFWPPWVQLAPAGSVSTETVAESPCEPWGPSQPRDRAMKAAIVHCGRIFTG